MFLHKGFGLKYRSHVNMAFKRELRTTAYFTPWSIALVIAVRIKKHQYKVFDLHISVGSFFFALFCFFFVPLHRSSSLFNMETRGNAIPPPLVKSSLMNLSRGRRLASLLPHAVSSVSGSSSSSFIITPCSSSSFAPRLSSADCLLLPTYAFRNSLHHWPAERTIS